MSITDMINMRVGRDMARRNSNDSYIEPIAETQLSTDSIGYIHNCSCPRCDSPMLVRTNKYNQKKFAGCSDYPVCRGARPISTSRNGEANNTFKNINNKSRISELEDKIKDLEDKVEEILHYYQSEEELT